MKGIRIRNHLINLAGVAWVSFDPNDQSTHADDRCSVVFIGGGDHLEFYGADAEEIFGKIGEALDAPSP